jgi:hypothetical protein
MAEARSNMMLKSDWPATAQLIFCFRAASRLSLR